MTMGAVGRSSGPPFTSFVALRTNHHPTALAISRRYHSIVSSPFGRLAVVVDARDKRVLAEMPEVERILVAKGLDYKIEEVTEPSEAALVTRKRLAGGHRFVVAVGGDRIVHQVVNGMVEDDRPLVAEPILGVIAAGADNDFLRTFGLPGDASAAAHLAGDNVYAIDVGKATCSDRTGPERARYFANIAEAGFGADVVTRAGTRGRLGHFFAFWRAVIGFKRIPIRVRAARKTYEGLASNVVVGNGRFGGGGWRVSPRSFPGDGVLEVLVMKGPRSETFTMLPQVYRGEQVPSPNIVELRGRDVTIEAERPLAVHVDGTIIGSTPASFTALPGLILMKI